MSSSGPGSVLVFLSFVILSSLLFGIYMTAYLGTIYAGEEVGKKGEAAVEQAVIYLFQHPTNVSIVDGSLVPKGETRIVIQNVGPREISFDRILAIGKHGDVVADVKVPGNKGLGARQWQMYRVQDLGLPERWNNFTVFQAEVSRIVLLSDRGRTHGSIWGVPPFLEGIFRVTISTTMTTSYIYNYIETRSYTTTYTITIPARQNAYSVTGEWWETRDGKNWYKVTNGAGRGTGDTFYGCPDCGGACRNSYSSSQSPTWWQVVSGMKANGERTVSDLGGYGISYWDSYGCPHYYYTPQAPPIIKYHKNGSQVTVVSEISQYTISWSRVSCGIVCGEDGIQCQCAARYSEGEDTYKFQAIELVDWDTGEVYASVNQTSFTFNINRNTIVRFKYVLVSSWSRSWEVILQPSPPTERCPEILNTKPPGDPEWCACAKQLLPRSEWEGICDDVFRSCLYLGVFPCCTGDETYACLNSWSGRGATVCVDIPQGQTKTITGSWSASWSLKPGWAFHDIIKSDPQYGVADCRIMSRSENSASGYCTVNAEPNRGYHVSITVIFKRTQ